MFFIIRTPTPTNSEKSCLDDSTNIQTFPYNWYYTSRPKILHYQTFDKKPQLNCNTFSNYRPISQLPILTKLLEKVIYKQLIFYLTANNILDHQQSEFRKLHSTETTILSLHDDLLKSLDNDFQTQLLLLDLYSAFDIINLDYLIYRLKLIELEDNVLLWFSNYITNRI